VLVTSDTLVTNTTREHGYHFDTLFTGRVRGPWTRP